MKKTSYLLNACILLTALTWGCKEDFNKPMNNNSVKPNAVSNVTVKSINGGAEITYTQPSDPDLLYVKAVYQLSSGERREVKSSFYNNNLVVDGFSDTVRYNVSLYAVNRSEVESDPVNVDVRPLESPLFEAFKSAKLAPAFGGVTVSTINTHKGELGYNLLIFDSGKNKYVDYKQFYSSSVELTNTWRGIEPTEHKFGLFMTDRWLNQTDTIFSTITPLLEIELDKSKFRPLTLPTDDPCKYNGTGSSSLAKLWDKNYTSFDNALTGTANDLNPMWFSWDLGQKAKLSRIAFWLYRTNNGSYYYGKSPKEYEIWGSNNPNPDGSWESWTKLMDCSSKRPSGLPEGALDTSDDYAAALKGESFDVPSTAPAVRYLRFKLKQNWMSTSALFIYETNIWGDPNQ